MRAPEEEKAILEGIKSELREGKLNRKEVAYVIQEKLGLSQGPAYRIGRRVLLDLEIEKDEEEKGNSGDAQ